MNQIMVFMNEVLDCVDQAKTGKLRMSDIDRMFITVNANRSGPTNPSNALVRY
jgi:hypothetical protein